MNPSEYQAIGDPQRWREQPLPVTGLFLCYQQVRFVGEALDGALSQTVPMQLIVSDDGSSDGTAEVLVDRLRDYRGPHQVLLRVGHPNLGLVPHFNRLMERAEGELIVLFAGDDISYPQRVQRLVQEATANPMEMIWSSAFDVCCGEGQRMWEWLNYPERTFDLEEYLSLVYPLGMMGCGMALRRQVYSCFGEMSESLWAEDMELLFRGLLIGNGRFLKDRLLKYRYTGVGLGQNKAAYGNDLASIIEAHRNWYVRIRGRSNALESDVNIAINSFQVNPGPINKFREKLIYPWSVEERLHHAVSFLKRRFWFWPALHALRLPNLRSRAIRLIFIALWPGLFFWLKAVRHRGERVRPAPEIEPR